MTADTVFVCAWLCVFVFVFVQIHHFNQRLGVFLQAFGGVYFQRPINQTLPAVFGPPAAADHRRHDVKAKTKNKNKTELNQTAVTRPDQNKNGPIRFQNDAICPKTVILYKVSCNPNL